MHEVEIPKDLDHPNIIWLHEVIDDPDGTIYLVTEYYPNGSLGEYSVSHGLTNW